MVIRTNLNRLSGAALSALLVVVGIPIALAKHPYPDNDGFRVYEDNYVANNWGSSWNSQDTWRHSQANQQDQMRHNQESTQDQMRHRSSPQNLLDQMRHQQLQRQDIDTHNLQRQRDNQRHLGPG